MSQEAFLPVESSVVQPTADVAEGTVHTDGLSDTVIFHEVFGHYIGRHDSLAVAGELFDEVIDNDFFKVVSSKRLSHQFEQVHPGREKDVKGGRIAEVKLGENNAWIGKYLDDDKKLKLFTHEGEAFTISASEQGALAVWKDLSDESTGEIDAVSRAISEEGLIVIGGEDLKPVADMLQRLVWETYFKKCEDRRYNRQLAGILAASLLLGTAGNVVASSIEANNAQEDTFATPETINKEQTAENWLEIVERSGITIGSDGNIVD